MIVVAGSVRVKPESREAAIRAALEMAAATRREPGCRAYRFSVDLADPLLFYVHEEWESDAALREHFATSHMAVFQQALPALLAAPPDVGRFEISSVGPVI
jgi:quinol monooxygenase YgiN